MFLLGFCHWLAGTTIGILMRDSTYAFPIVEIFHLLSLAFFGGVVLLVDLRFLNLGFKTQPVSQVAQEFLPLTAGGVIAMSITGALLFAGGTLRYYHNPAFRLKMILFGIALFVHFGLQIGIARRGAKADVAAGWVRCGAIVSLLLWLSIGLSGRAIGYV